ncbi:MAG TPA: 3-hydroxyisobutyrate dehydrogenase [Gammaproteobacteria bacterium]|jgi:3-hydroxyisobutyrate dehydrogenase|nr:3-hydroxyisobutyrate dehydrogenase [Gammaproteobacteria bacterium]
MSVIAWIGLGHMGAPMALHLVQAGHTVKGFDVVPVLSQALVKDGLQAAASIAEAVKDADVVFTMVQTSEQVHDLCLQPEGIFAHVKPGVIYVDASSIDIAMTTSLHEAAKSRGIAMLDAPVSGGVGGAKAATLTVMVGGDLAVFNAVKPIFQTYGKNIVHAGGAGLGQAAKICNNLILGVTMVGVCEGFMLAEKLGLNSKTFFDISSVSSGQCWSMTSYCPAPNILPNVPSSHDYEPGFMAKMMLKDLNLAKHAADYVHAMTPMSDEALNLYQQYTDAGNAEKDFSGIITWLANLKAE